MPRFASRALGALCVVSLALPLAAQEQTVGFRSGLVYGGMTGPGYASFNPGLTVGPTITIPVTRWLALQTEATYSAYSFGWIEPTPTAASLKQFSVPLMARVDLRVPVDMPVRLTLMGGAYSSYSLQCRLSTGDTCFAANELSPFANTGRFDVGPTGGLALSADLFGTLRVGAEARYSRGFREYGFLGSGLRSETWSFGLRLAALGIGTPTGAYADAPQQRALPNERVRMR